MKSIFRSLSMAVVVAGVAVTGAFAQDVCDDLDTPTAKYEGFLKAYGADNKIKNRIDDLPTLKSALSDGKEFLEKWGACDGWKDQIAYVKPRVPGVEAIVKEMEEFQILKPKFDRFDAGIKSDNVDEIYAAGKEILSIKPSNNNVKYVMAVSSVLEISKAAQNKTTSKYASEAMTLAKPLYDQIKNGSLKFDRKIEGKDSIGVLKWERPKEEALSQLAYTIGFANYYGLNNKKAAVLSYYEVTQLSGFYKTYPPVYVTISDFYRDEALNIVKESSAKTAEYNALVDEVKKLDPNAPGAKEKAEQLDAQIKAKDVEIKAKDALIKGYIERAMDALARAHKVAKDGTPAEKKYKADLYSDLQELYKQRFEKDAGLDQWVASATAKPFPDPTSAVQPVNDEPATTTTTVNTTATPAGNGNGAAVAKRP